MALRQHGWKGATLTLIFFVLFSFNATAAVDMETKMDSMKADMDDTFASKFDDTDDSDSTDDTSDSDSDSTDSTSDGSDNTVEFTGDFWDDSGVSDGTSDSTDDDSTDSSSDDTSDSTDTSDNSDSDLDSQMEDMQNDMDAIFAEKFDRDLSDNDETTSDNSDTTDDSTDDNSDSTSDSDGFTGDFWDEVNSDDTTDSTDSSSDDSSDSVDDSTNDDSTDNAGSDDTSVDPGTASNLEDRTELALHNLINEERQQRGLQPLNLDPTLRQTADAKSELMASTGIFSHHINGENFRDIYADYGYDCRIPTSSGTYLGGENIARTWFDRNVRTDTGATVRYDTAEELADGLRRQWMTSDAHRDAILRPYYDDHGLGVEITSDNRVYATEHFC